MALIVILALFVPAVLFVVGLAAVRAATAHDLDPVGRAARRRSIAATGATLTAGAAALWAWNELALVDLPIRLATMPALAGTVAVLAASVAELTWPRPRGQVRVASLTARRGVGAPRLRDLLGATTALTAAALLTGALSAGGTGRQLVRAWGDRAVAHGPYPGLSYAVPVATACAALLAATALGLHLVGRRPGLAIGHDATDRAVRLASAVRVLRPAVFGMGATAAGLLFVMGQAALGVTSGDGYPSAGLRSAGFVAISLAVASAAVAVAAVVWPSPRLPAEPRSTAPQPAAVTSS